MFKEVIALNNLDKVKIEIKGISFTDDKLNVLESIANNVELMKNYKTEE